MEVGRESTVTKYEIHIRMRTRKDGPVIRNMIRFPHAVQTESRICVICPPGSKQAKDAIAAGAVLVGEDEVFEAIKAGKIEFDRCLAHPDSLPALNKAALGRVLGPRGLMPSVKTGTVVEDVASRVEDLRGGTVYRERDAVIRLPIGQLGFSPEQLRDNLRTTIDSIKKDAAGLNDRINKEIYEVVSVSAVKLLDHLLIPHPGAELNPRLRLQLEWRVQDRRLPRNLGLDRRVKYLLSYIRLACTNYCFIRKEHGVSWYHFCSIETPTNLNADAMYSIPARLRLFGKRKSDLYLEILQCSNCTDIFSHEVVET